MVMTEKASCTYIFYFHERKESDQNNYFLRYGQNILNNWLIFLLSF